MFQDLSRATAYYCKASDTLELEIDPRIKRSATIAYEDIFLVHLGTIDGRLDQPLIQGYTFIGFQAIRRRIHGNDIAEPEVGNLGTFLSDMDLEYVDDTIVVKDRSKWAQAQIKIKKQITPVFEIVQDFLGDPIGIVIQNTVTVTAMCDFLDIVFAALISSNETDFDPFRYALAKSVTDKWIAPLFASAA